MEEGSKKDEVAIEIMKADRAIRDLETYPTLSTGGILLMKFLKFMLAKKRVKYPIKWIRWLREYAVVLTVADTRQMDANMMKDNFHAPTTTLVLITLVIPSRPAVPDGVKICLKWIPKSDSHPMPYFEISKGNSDATLIRVDVKDLFHRREHEDWLTAVGDAFGDVHNLLWMCMLMSAYDFENNLIRLKMWQNFMLGDCDALPRLQHELWLDSM